MLATQWNSTRFVLKHTAAAAIVIAGTTLFAVVSSLLLFLRAVAGGGDSLPVEFPVLVLGGAAAATVSVAAVLMPATILAERASQRLGLRIWWQIPISAAIALGLALTGGLLYAGVANQPVSASLAIAAAAGGALLVPLGVYWWALQSADWVLRKGGRVLARIWPSRFRGLATTEPPIQVRSVRRLARFRVKEQFLVDVGSGPMLVVSGDVLEGDVRSGMRACANVDRREVSARIHSVEYVGHSISEASNVGLLLPVSELDLNLWQSAARSGAELKII
jgi:hypothetical protein